MIAAAGSTNNDGCGVRVLLAAGADPNAKSNEKKTPLHFAVESDSLESVKMLLEGISFLLF